MPMHIYTYTEEEKPLSASRKIKILSVRTFRVEVTEGQIQSQIHIRKYIISPKEKSKVKTVGKFVSLTLSSRT